MEGGCGTIVRGRMVASAHAKVVKNTVYGEKRIRRKESDGAKLLTNQRIALNFRVDIQTCFGQIKIRWHTFFRCHFPTVRSFDGTCGVHSCRRTSCLFDSGSQWRPRICRKFTRTHRQSKSRFNYSMHVYYAIYDFVESADLQSRDPQWIYYAHKSLCFLFFVPLQSWQGLYGQNVLSQYSKAVDSAHSSVRVHSSRQSNDIIGAHGKRKWHIFLSINYTL